MASDAREYATTSVSSLGSEAPLEELQTLAERMRRELRLKDRVVGASLHKDTFKGQQAAAWLTAVGVASTFDEAAEVLSRLLRAGYIKQLHGQQLLAGVGTAEVYRFVFADMDGAGTAHTERDHRDHHKTKLISTSRRLSSGTLGAGLYKELAKFGKAAAHPFNKMALEIAGSSHHKASSGHKSDSETTSRSGHHHHQYQLRASQQQQQQQVDYAATLTALIGHLNETQSHIKEGLGLMRLDLQQHTALQEHMISEFQDMGRHSLRLQLLIGLQCVFLAFLVLAAGPVYAMLLATLGAAAAGTAVLLRFGVLDGAMQRLGLRAQKPAVSFTRSFVRAESGDVGQLNTPRKSHAGSKRQSAADCEAASTAEASDALDDDDAVEENDEDTLPYLSDFEEWPDAPLIMRPNAVAPQQRFNGVAGPCQSVRINSAAIPFESEVFKGALLVFIRGLASTPPQLFKGKKRVSWIVLQGTFKQPMSLDSVVFGQEFRRAFKNLPAPWFIDNMLLPLARKISPSLRFGSLDAPYMMTPLVTASQIVHVAVPGSAPGIMEAEEDMRLFNPELEKAGAAASTSQRRKYYQNSSNRVKSYYTTEHVWTFHLWQEFLDFGSNTLNLSYQSYDLNQHLDGEPLQVMIKDTASGSYLVNCQLWHRSTVAALPPSARPQRQRRRRSTEDGSSMEAATPPIKQVQRSSLSASSSTPGATAAAPAAAAAAAPAAAGAAGPRAEGSPESFAFASPLPSRQPSAQQQGRQQQQGQQAGTSRSGSPQSTGMPPLYPPSGVTDSTSGINMLQRDSLPPVPERGRVLGKPSSFSSGASPHAAGG